jgi:hypothetical protein
MVQRGFSGEAWSVVDFQQIDSASVIHHEVEAQYLEAHIIA